MNLYGYNKKYYATLINDIMQDYWHQLILPQLLRKNNYLEPWRKYKRHVRYYAIKELETSC